MIGKDVKEFLVIISTISIILIVMYVVMNSTGTRSDFQQKVDSALDAIKSTKKDTVITVKSGKTKIVIKVKK